MRGSCCVQGRCIADQRETRAARELLAEGVGARNPRYIIPYSRPESLDLRRKRVGKCLRGDRSVYRNPITDKSITRDNDN